MSTTHFTEQEIGTGEVEPGLGNTEIIDVPPTTEPGLLSPSITPAQQTLPSPLYTLLPLSVPL